jgi:HlyD family secretion protein
MAQKSRRRWGWVAFAAVVVLIVAMGLVGRITKKIPIRAAVTTEGTIQAYVEERGRTSLPHTYHITMPIQGRVLPINIEEGDKVDVGEVVVRLDDSDWQDATKETKEIIRAVANWVESVKAQVKAGQIWQDYTKWEWEADANLLESSFVSEKQERESKRRYLDSTVKIEETQAIFHMSKAFEAIADLLPTYVQRNLERTLVKSPVSGTILRRHVWNEKVMTPGEPLLDVGNLEELEITADILTEAAVRIQPGDKVEIFGETLGNTKITGTVRLVEPEAFTKISSLGVEEQRVAVKISFANGELEKLIESGRSIGLQYRVRVRVITDEKTKTALVPRTALFHGIKGQWQVYKITGDRARLTDVQVGLMNDFETEIVAGLQPGDSVIIAPESSVSDGVKVLATK